MRRLAAIAVLLLAELTGCQPPIPWPGSEEGLPAPLTPTPGAERHAPLLAGAMSQTHDGYMVTIYPVYADVNRIVLTYTVSAASDDVRTAPAFAVDRFDGNRGYNIQLSDWAGHDFPLSYSVRGWIANGEVIPGWADAEGRGLVIAFDPSGLPDLPPILDLHLVFGTLAFRQNNSLLGVTGPFTFDFSMPVDRLSRVADLQQTATSGEDTYTLERVVVTRNETRAFLRYQRPQSSAWYPYVALEAGDWSSQEQIKNGNWAWNGDDYLGGYRLGFRAIGAPLMDVNGTWMLAVWYKYSGNAVRPDQPGPAFHFTVPPATTPPAPTPAPPPPPTPTPVPPPPPSGPPQLLQQTVNGYTMTLQPLAADANRILLHYNLTDPQGQTVHFFGARRDEENYILSGPQLTDMGGHVLPITAVGYPQPGDGGVLPDAIAATFDANRLDPLTSPTTLRLLVDPNLGTPAPPPGTITQPFIFSFTMPADTGRQVAEVGQAVAANGLELTLRRVIVTTTETHFVLGYGTSGPVGKCGEPSGQLLIGGETLPMRYVGQFTNLWRNGDDCVVRYNGKSLLNTNGDWTWTIDSFTNTYRSVSGQTPGPWTFRFPAPTTP